MLFITVVSVLLELLNPLRQKKQWSKTYKLLKLTFLDVKIPSLKSLLKTPQTLVQNQIEIGYPSIESVVTTDV
jgi:hypothetical protein